MSLPTPVIAQNPRSSDDFTQSVVSKSIGRQGRYAMGDIGPVRRRKTEIIPATEPVVPAPVEPPQRRSVPPAAPRPAKKPAVPAKPVTEPA